MNALTNLQTHPPKPLLGSSQCVSVRLAQTANENLSIFRFRYHNYTQTMNRDKDLADHKNRILTDYLDPTALQIAAFKGNRVVGALRINLSEDTEFGEEELYHFSQLEEEFPRKIALLTKLIVDPAHRGSRLFLRLFREALQLTAQREIQRHIILTSNSLAPTFEKLGFVQYTPRTTRPDCGASNPMIFNPDDIDHLKNIASPLLPAVIQSYGHPNNNFERLKHNH